MASGQLDRRQSSVDRGTRAQSRFILPQIFAVVDGRQAVSFPFFRVDFLDRGQQLGTESNLEFEMASMKLVPIKLDYLIYHTPP